MVQIITHPTFCVLCVFACHRNLEASTIGFVSSRHYERSPPVFWIAVFVVAHIFYLARVLFFAYLHTQTSGLTMHEILTPFLLGLRMDVAMIVKIGDLDNFVEII